MADVAIIFGAGFLWILLVSLQTRIVAHREDFWVPFGFQLSMSAVWVVVIRQVIFIDETWKLLGFPLGAAIATGIVTKFVPKDPNWLRREK